MRPIDALAISLAYIVDADEDRRPEEKAMLLSLLGKHLSTGEFKPADLENLSRNAFAFAAKTDLDKFLAEAANIMTRMQMISTYINVFEAMIIDGQVTQAENAILSKFETAFNLDRDTIESVREVMYVKNHTTMFLRPEHPRNDRAGFLAVRYTGHTAD
jgi:hypothetical protein